MPSQPVPQTQFFHSYVRVGGVYYPCYPGSTRIVCPKNYLVPPIIGNHWQVTYGEGLRQPMFEAQFAVKNEATGVLGTSSFLNYFLARTNDVAEDTTVISGGIHIWNGRRGFKMGGVKADSFTIGSSSNEVLRLTARFTGTTFLPFGTGDYAAFPGWNKQNLVSFKSVTFDEPLANAVWNFNLSYSNNHNPDLSHNGTEWASAQNASMPTVGFSCLVQAATLPSSVMPNNGTFPPPDNPDVLSFNVTASNVSRTFQLNHPVIQNPDDLTIQVPRNMQEYAFLCLGKDSATTGPLTVS